MNNQKKITIYNFKELFYILKELEKELNYQIEEIDTDNLKKKKF